MISRKRNFLRDQRLAMARCLAKQGIRKNRINHHRRCQWLVQADGTFNGQPAWLVSSIHKSDRGGFNSRWVLKQNDPDFIVN